MKMNYKLRNIRHLGMLMALVLVSCQPTGQGTAAATANQAVPTVDYTVWTDKAELFVEFPVSSHGFTPV